MTEDNLSPEEHHQRGRDDAKTSNKFGLSAAQAAILINGGAATALLAFLSAVIHQTQNGGVPTPFRAFIPVILLALFLYGAGVFLAAFALPQASRSIENFMMGHDRVPRRDAAYDHWDNAVRQWERFILLVQISLWLFAAATTVLAVGLFIVAICAR